MSTLIVRKILFPEREYRKIEEDRGRWLPKGLETGGYVFGKIYPNGLAEVVEVIDGGPNAVRRHASFSGDSEHARARLEELLKRDRDVVLLGEYHLHPWRGPAYLSGGDVSQLAEARRLRPWYVSFLITADDFKAWGLGDGGKPVEIPYQIVDVRREELFERILRITRNDLLMSKTVLIVGLGSGGSVIAEYLGCTGIGRFILVDHEELETANVIRHVGGVGDIGKRKVDIVKRVIEDHNPFAIVETHHFDVSGDAERLERLASEADLIIGSTGSSRVNHIINRVSIKLRKPAIYAGVYERASGGHVLTVIPFETACYNCVFGLERDPSYHIDKEGARRYGLDEDELHRQQGLWIDISIPALLAAKRALDILEGRGFYYNMVRYHSHIEIEKLRVGRREGCAVCSIRGSGVDESVGGLEGIDIAALIEPLEGTPKGAPG